jgi:hypothetical protein
MPRVGALIVWLPAISFGQTPKTFDSTEAAAQALTEAAEKDDVAAFRIFGPVGKAVLTSAIRSRTRVSKFARHARRSRVTKGETLWRLHYRHRKYNWKILSRIFRAQ